MTGDTCLVLRKTGDDAIEGITGWHRFLYLLSPEVNCNDSKLSGCMLPLPVVGETTGRGNSSASKLSAD